MVSLFKPKKKYVATALCVVAAFLSLDGVSVQAQGVDSPAAMEIRFQQMEKEIRRLTGQVEEQAYEIRQLKEELATVTGDLDVRMKDVEAGRASVAPTIRTNDSGYAMPREDEPELFDPPPAAPEMQDHGSFKYQPPGEGSGQQLGTLNKSPDGGAVTSGDNAPRAYEYAYSFVKAREFDRAEQAFADFIRNYPNHTLVSNAKYWYGETFYVRGQYEKSAKIFAEGYQKYPDGPKASSNLLKLGMALKGMGKTEDACIAFKQLKKDYSDAAVPVLKRAETEMQRINCT